MTLKLKAEEELRLAFDAGSFYFDENESRWELYFSAPDIMFTYQKSTTTTDLLMGKISIQIKIQSNERVVIEDSWTIINQIKSVADLKQNYIFGVKSFLLQPGQYKVELTAYDVNNAARKFLVNQDVIIPKFDKNRINHSEIQFASFIEKISTSNLNIDPMYMKYDYYIIPNPRSEFFGDKARLIGAMEIYHSDKFSKAGIIRSYKISDNTGNILFYSKDTCKDISENILTVFNLPLDTLNSGVYFFSITTNYPLDNPEDSVTSNKKFYYFNQHKPPVTKRYFSENELFEKSEFNTMTPEQTDLELNKSLVIATLEEIYQAKALNETKAKQRFLFKYWAKRDSDTLTRWNETLRTYRENIEFANRFFAYGKNKQGWKTERGRVLLKYGVPTQRDINISTGAERSYEDWFYENVQGGVHFYFVDLSSIGNYILVHSTAMDEPYYPDWFNRYVPTTQDGRTDGDLQNEGNSLNPYGR
jgi:GWxTD domain-containing protein